MSDTPPQCPNCDHPLDRIDHDGIEHTILDPQSNIYRPLSGMEPPGIATEIKLTCGYCHWEIPAEHRRFFYEHWWQLQQMIDKGEI